MDQSLTRGRAYWIGLHDLSDEGANFSVFFSSQVNFCVTGTFEWDLEGRESNYANWAVGEPNGDPRSNFYQEDCVFKRFSESPGGNASQWIDFSCRKDAWGQSGIHALCSQSNKGEDRNLKENHSKSSDIALYLPRRIWSSTSTNYRVS